MVYLSGRLSLSALETLAHADASGLPGKYAACPLDVPDGIRIESISVARAEKISRDWRAASIPGALQKFGDTWVRGMKSALLEVPSVIIPPESNYVVNIAHPDFHRMRRPTPERFQFDPRLYLDP